MQLIRARLLTSGVQFPSGTTSRISVKTFESNDKKPWHPVRSFRDATTHRPSQPKCHETAANKGVGLLELIKRLVLANSSTAPGMEDSLCEIYALCFIGLESHRRSLTVSSIIADATYMGGERERDLLKCDSSESRTHEVLNRQSA
jgi:hypothetical protein